MVIHDWIEKTVQANQVKNEGKLVLTQYRGTQTRVWKSQGYEVEENWLRDSTMVPKLKALKGVTWSDVRRRKH